MLRIKPKYIAVILLAGGLTAAAIAQNKDDKKQPPRPKNLKVLSYKISHDSLIDLMKEYSVSLGVRCGFCHAKSADGEHLDFASDENGKKKVARYMMTMTSELNKKYFAAENGGSRRHTALMVSCYTCHHGHEEPEAFVMPKEEEKH